MNAKWFAVLVLLLFSIIYFNKSDQRFGWTKETPNVEHPIIADGSGYYAYLPQWFIYQTSNFDFQPEIIEKYQISDFHFKAYSSPITGNHCNKYYPGTAVAIAPFFMIAHFQAGMDGDDQDGYSRPYLFWVNISSIFYFLLGCIACFLVLRMFNIERFWILTSIFILAFATNLSFYSNVYIPYSHVYSFAFIAWFVYFTLKWARTGRVVHLFILAACLGMIFLIRPTNVLIVLILPFLFESNSAFLKRIKWLFSLRKLIYLLISLLLFVAFIAFQLWNIYDQSGEWSLNTYKAEGFDYLTSPKVWNVLFSWSKGLFIFAPALLLFFPGMFILFKKNRRLFWGTLLLFSVFTYVISSWWCWWYGGGLGMRPFVDLFVLLIIPISFLFQNANNIIRFILVAFVALTTFMYQVYDFQMRKNILHYDQMTKEQFFSVFMKEDQRYEWCLHLAVDTLPENIQTLPYYSEFKINNKDSKPIKDVFYDKIYGDEPFVSFSTKSFSFKYKDFYFGAKVSAEVFLLNPETNPIFETVIYKNGQELKKYNQFVGVQIDQVRKWEKVLLDIDPKVKMNDFDSISIRFFEGNRMVKAKDFKSKFFFYR